MNRILTVILLLVTLVANAQNKVTIDSLMEASVNSATETQKAEALYQLSREWAEYNFDSAFHYAVQLNQAATNANDAHLQGLALIAKGLAHDYNNHFDSALLYYQQAFELGIANGDDEVSSKAIFNQGVVHFYSGKMELAIDKYQEADAYFKSIDDRIMQAKVQNNLALIYRRTQQLDMAKIAFQNAIELYGQPTGYSVNVFSPLTNLSAMHVLLEEYDSAILTARKTMDIAKKLNNENFYVLSLVNIGQPFTKLDEWDSAFRYYSEAEKYLDESSPYAMRFYVPTGLASYYLNRNEFKKSKPYMDQLKALGVPKNTDAEHTYRLMWAKYYKGVGDFKNSLEQLEIAKGLKDQLVDQDLLRKTTRLEQLYKKQQRELEIEKLQAQNTSKTLLIEKTQLKYQLLIVIVVLSLLLSVMAILYFLQKQKKARVEQQLLHEEIDSLRLKISSISSDLKLDKVEISRNEEGSLLTSLTEREIDILQIAVTNKTNAEIADEVCLSINTVKYHLKNIYVKLGVSSRLEAREIVVGSS